MTLHPVGRRHAGTDGLDLAVLDQDRALGDRAVGHGQDRRVLDQDVTAGLKSRLAVVVELDGRRRRSAVRPAWPARLSALRFRSHRPSPVRTRARPELPAVRRPGAAARARPGSRLAGLGLLVIGRLGAAWPSGYLAFATRSRSARLSRFSPQLRSSVEPVAISVRVGMSTFSVPWRAFGLAFRRPGDSFRSPRRGGRRPPGPPGRWPGRSPGSPSGAGASAPPDRPLVRARSSGLISNFRPSIST